MSADLRIMFSMALISCNRDFTLNRRFHQSPDDMPPKEEGNKFKYIFILANKSYTSQWITFIMCIHVI